MKLIILFLTGIFSQFVISSGWAQGDVQLILNRYAQDYLNDPTFKKNQLFGVKVGESFWTVKVNTKTEKETAKAIVTNGQPDSPTFIYVINENTLKDLDSGKINVLTGSVKAFSHEYAPVEFSFMEGFAPSAHFVDELIPFTFHFWTRGFPEIVPFGPQHTRATHGVQATIFYYQKGIRYGYAVIHPGQHANEHPKSQENEFPSFMVLISGKIIVRLDGKDYPIDNRNGFFIPPGVRHEILNHSEEAAEILLLMFGEGA